MTTTFEVRDSQGQLLGTYPKTELTTTVKALVQANPGATVKPIIDYVSCPEHPAYESTNCPLCGTARKF